MSGRDQSILDHQIDAVVQHLRASLGSGVRVVHGWPRPGQSPDVDPLPLAAVRDVNAGRLTVRRPWRRWTLEPGQNFPAPGEAEAAPAEPSDEAIVACQVGGFEADLQVDLWCKDKTQRLDVEERLRRAFVLPASGTASVVLTLDGRFGEQCRCLAGQMTRTDEGLAGVRSMLPVTARSPYVVEDSASILRRLEIHSEFEPADIGLAPETIVVFE